jgi:hypothetical protein
MDTEVKKLHLIEELLKVDSDIVLAEVEKVLSKSKTHVPQSQGFKNFKNTLTLDEVNEMERNIEEGCEQINEDDWK